MLLLEARGQELLEHTMRKDTSLILRFRFSKLRKRNFRKFRLKNWIISLAFKVNLWNCLHWSLLWVNAFFLIWNWRLFFSASCWLWIMDKLLTTLSKDMSYAWCECLKYKVISGLIMLGADFKTVQFLVFGIVFDILWLNGIKLKCVEWEWS